jgi:hypothetical protein
MNSVSSCFLLNVHVKIQNKHSLEQRTRTRQKNLYIRTSTTATHRTDELRQKKHRGAQAGRDLEAGPRAHMPGEQDGAHRPGGMTRSG